MVDVTVVLALHREGTLLRRTLLSLRDAAAHAQTQGRLTELVVTLDRSDEPTRQVLRDFVGHGFERFTVVETDHGSLGPSRNSGVARATGRFVTTADGDDLISFNSLTEMCRVAEKVGPSQIIVPQYLYAFGQRQHCWEYFPLDVVTPLAFLLTHPYISRVFAHREAFQQIAYADASSSSGYAYEDWHFNAEWVARGFGVTVAKDTILFYRQSSISLVQHANTHSTRQIPPCTLFDPDTWVRITASDYERLAPLGGLLPDVPEAQPPPGRWKIGVHKAALEAANKIDPAIDPVWLTTSKLESNVLEVQTVSVGIAYHEICKIVSSQRFEEVFLLPFITTGGAERYLRDVMQSLYEMSPTARMLVVLGESLEEGCYSDRVPPNATVLDLGVEWPHLTMEQRYIVTLKLIQSTAPTARLHMRAAPFSHGFYSKFGRILHGNSTVYYRFCDESEVTPEGVIERPWGFNFVADHVQDWSMVVTDNEYIIARDCERIGLFAEKWRFLPALHIPNLPIGEAIARSEVRKGRVLWASRLDAQKRPDLLPLIAEYLALRAPDIRIDVFGSAILSSFNLAASVNLPNLVYCGPFDGFGSIEHGAYDAFVYTSAYDGMPNVVLEAVAAGLPIIAPDIGGLQEIIIDGESGLMLPSLENEPMAAAYATAIIRLLLDTELRKRLIEGAMTRLVSRYGPETFTREARAIFGQAAGRARDSNFSEDLLS